MEFDEKKKSGRIKRALLVAMSVLSFGVYNQNEGNANSYNSNNTEISTRSVSGKITEIKAPQLKEKKIENISTEETTLVNSEETTLVNSYAKKFLNYNESKIDSSLILKKVKGNLSKLVYLDKEGTRVIKLDAINPNLVNYTLQLSTKYNVNPKLMLIIALIESRLGIDVKKSSAGAQGPFQVMPLISNHYGEEYDLKDPLIESAFLLVRDYAKTLNIDVSYNCDLSSEDITLITAAYNAGMTNIRNKPEKVFLNPGYFNETKSYSLYALSALNHYKFDTGLKDNKGNSILV